MDIVFLVLISIGVICRWGQICNIRTFRQRTNFLKAGDPLFWEKLEKYEKVSYDKHLWHLFTFRNALKLYK
jgi:hypothetical protein